MPRTRAKSKRAAKPSSADDLSASSPRASNELDGVGVTQPEPDRYQLRFKFGDEVCCEVAVQRGEDAAAVAKKLRELADQVEARSK
jgi:hypothetical protein